MTLPVVKEVGKKCEIICENRKVSLAWWEFLRTLTWLIKVSKITGELKKVWINIEANSTLDHTGITIRFNGVEIGKIYFNSPGRKVKSFTIPLDLVKSRNYLDVECWKEWWKWWGVDFYITVTFCIEYSGLVSIRKETPIEWVKLFTTVIAIGVPIGIGLGLLSYFLGKKKVKVIR